MRMSDQEKLGGLIETWRRAAEDFIALAREVTPEQEDLPTDLPGWSVKDNVAHTAHLEAILAGAPEETIEVTGAEHIKGLSGWYTEQGVQARRGRSMAELIAELEDAVENRAAALAADPPTDGSAAPPKTPGDIGWDNARLLSNRPLDIWMHEQDIRRAIGSPGGLDSPAATHTLKVFGGALPLVLGKRVAPGAGTSVVVVLPDRAFGATVGDDGRAVRSVEAAPTARISLSPESFILLAGGRRSAEEVDAKVEGDEALARELLANLAVTP